MLVSKRKFVLCMLQSANFSEVLTIRVFEITFFLSLVSSLVGEREQLPLHLNREPKHPKHP